VRAAGGEPDPYQVLGVARTATAAEIRAAYRALGAKYHPDRHQGNPLEELASAKMAEINRAYELLSDPARRAAFDRGAAGGGGFSRHPTASGAADAGAPGPSSRASRRLIQIVALASLLPLVLRFGGLILRALVAIGRELVEAAAVLRGTPAAAAAVALAAAILVATLVRRRRQTTRAQPSPAPPSPEEPGGHPETRP